MTFRIPLSRPSLNASDRRAVARVLKTNTLSGGPALAEFEGAFAQYHGVEQAVGLASGTQGLILALRALGVGHGDQVLIPSFTFVAVINAVWAVGAVPVVLDVEPRTWNMDMRAASRYQDAKAAIVVHNFGMSIDPLEIDRLQDQHGIPVIEDACEALGSRYAGHLAGTRGRCGVFGFYPNKPITTGEGGMLITGDPELADKIRVLANQGRKAGQWLDHEEPGTNARLSEMQAALGASQLARIEQLLARRQRVAEWYGKVLVDVGAVTLAPQISEQAHAWFTYPILVDKDLRDRLQVELAAKGIQTGRYFPPIHLQPVFKTQATRMDQQPINSEQLAHSCLCLPLFPELRRREVQDVVAVIRSFLSHCR